MKFRSLILIYILCISSIGVAKAVEPYHELGINPMYSMLNPAYIEGGEDMYEHDTVMDMFQRRKEKATNKNNIKVNSPQFIKDKSQNEKEPANSIILNKEDAIKSFFEPDTVEKEDETVTEEQEPKFMEFEPFNSKVKNEKSDSDDGKFVSKKKKSNADLVKEIEKEQKLKEKEASGEVDVPFKERLKFWKNIKKSEKPKKEEVETPQEPDLKLSADFMEYFPDKYEVEAVGNAKIAFQDGSFILSANKITFNYDQNIVTARENVVLLSNDVITEGDFIRLDLSKPEGFISNPISKSEGIQLAAKEAYLYSDRIEEYDGVAKILADETLKLGVSSFSGYVDPGNVFASKLRPSQRETVSGVYSIKAKNIYIDSKDNNEVVTIKNASLYLKNRKIGSIPSVKVYSNKERTNIETNAPELGSISSLGSYIGPAVVLNVPGGSTLKLAPVLTYGDNKLGIGGIARFRNQYNMTEVAYGTSKDNVLVRGRQKIAPGLTFDYSRLMNQSEWFMGYRKPKYAAQLRYGRTDYVKDLDLYFAQMYTAGAFVDNMKNKDLRDTEGRFRWMTQSYKSLYNYRNEEGNVGVNFGLVAQTGATVYTTGDVHGIVRVGPSINTEVGPWQQSLMYYQSAIAGKSPFDFDRYRYGRSNVVLIESLRVCRYLTLGYLTSLALNRDARNDDLFQENRFLVSVGPDYAKVTVGYDAIRNNTMLLFSMLVGTKDSDVKFKRTVIKNPQKFGQTNSKSKDKEKEEKKALKKRLKKEVKEQKQKEKEYAKELENLTKEID